MDLPVLTVAAGVGHNAVALGRTHVELLDFVLMKQFPKVLAPQTPLL